jgi:hypothetical protein
VPGAPRRTRLCLGRRGEEDIAVGGEPQRAT